MYSLYTTIEMEIQNLFYRSNSMVSTVFSSFYKRWWDVWKQAVSLKLLQENLKNALKGIGKKSW